MSQRKVIGMADREISAGEPASSLTLGLHVNPACAGGAVPAGATGAPQPSSTLPPSLPPACFATIHPASPPTWRRCPRRRPPWRPSCRHRSGRAWRLGTWTAATRTSGCRTGEPIGRRAGQGRSAQPLQRAGGGAACAFRAGLLTLACLPAALPAPPSRLSPNEPCPPEALHALGVRYWALDAGRYEAGDPQLAAIRKARGYSYEDCITITPGGVGLSCRLAGERWHAEGWASAASACVGQLCSCSAPHARPSSLPASPPTPSPHPLLPHCPQRSLRTTSRRSGPSTRSTCTRMRRSGTSWTAAVSCGPQLGSWAGSSGGWLARAGNQAGCPSTLPANADSVASLLALTNYHVPLPPVPCPASPCLLRRRLL